MDASGTIRSNRCRAVLGTFGRCGMVLLGWSVLGATAAVAQSLPAVDGAPGSALQAVPEASRLGSESIFGGRERLPTSGPQGRIRLPGLAAATTATDEIGNGSVPPGYTHGFEELVTVLPERIEQRDLAWQWSQYSFAPPNTFSHPLYFEDVMLERHGHERFPLLQPLVSGGKLLATFPMLPYLMTVQKPWEVEYKLGHFRSGDPVYPYLQRPPYERRAALVQAAATSGLIFVWP